MKVRGPIFSQVAHGWLGKTVYARTGVVVNPYPLAMLPFIRRVYRMPAWGFRPYPQFVSTYYSNIGWCYQERRTWHGMQPVIQRPSLNTARFTPLQDIYRTRWANAVLAWQGFNQATKDIYNKMQYPTKCTGFNRFMKQFIKTEPLEELTSSYLLMEDRGKLLQESGGGILL